MGSIRGLGALVGKTAGIVIGGPIQVIGEMAGSELIEGIGKGVRQASEFTGDTIGQAAGGMVSTVSGMIHDNAEQRDKGLGEMGSAVGRTAKGVVHSAKNVIHNGGEVIGGFMDGDTDRVKSGAASIVKTVAVGVLAVGVVDVFDGADTAEATEGTDVSNVHDTKSITDTIQTDQANAVQLGSVENVDTINEDLAGKVNSDTGVPFEHKIVELPDGQFVSGVFPEFDVEHEVHLDESLYLQSDYVHFTYANHELYESIQTNPELADDLGLSQQDIIGLSKGDTPAGFSWHHNEEPGVMQLVHQDEHAHTSHTGGRELWGGGGEYR